ncbi:MAG TPA: PilZ domain-containing protein [Terracidiphilus sp.]|nr:PilZ domain-containing protein [Terracidiphilus sp.]
MGSGETAGGGRKDLRERRASLRQTVDDQASIFLINLAATMTGRIVNLSAGGCCIRTDQRFQLGVYRRVEVEFRLEGMPVRLCGVIQAIHDPHHVGIRFLDVSERKRDQLLQLISEIEEAHAEQEANSASAKGRCTTDEG